MSCDYLIIILLGILGSAYYNIISGILRGLGDSVMPLIFLLVACGMNIGLDIWFVAGLKWALRALRGQPSSRRQSPASCVLCVCS